MATELNKKTYLEDYLRVQQYVCGAFLRHVDVIHVTMDSRLPFYTTHSHEELEILFVTNGTANVIVDGNCFSAQKGDFVVFMPQTLHCVKPCNDQLTFTAFVVNPVVAWQGQFTQNITQMLQNNNLPVVISPNSHCYSLVKQQVDAMLKGEDATISNNMLDILHLLCTQTSAPIHHDFTQNKRLYTIKMALQHTQAHYSDSITVEDIAALCNYSTFYTMKLFKTYTGLPFIEYLNCYRLVLAANQMLTTTKEIQQIAQEMGFHNISYFNRQFRKLYNTTPKQFQASFCSNDN